MRWAGGEVWGAESWGAVEPGGAAKGSAKGSSRGSTFCSEVAGLRATREVGGAYWAGWGRWEFQATVERDEVAAGMG